MSAPPSLEFQARPGCLFVVVRGREILENKSVTIQAIAAALKEHQVKAALLDVRAVPGILTFMDRFQLGTHAGRFLGGMSIGVLARSDQADPQRIGQLVAQNRGVDVQVFTEATEADAWLNKRVRQT